MAKYNTKDISNEQAVGFNNLEARKQNPENLTEAAHPCEFDKLLAEFFLTKRSDIKKGK